MPPFLSEINAGACLLHCSPEELPHNFYRRGHGNPVLLPPKDIAQGLISPSHLAVIGLFRHSDKTCKIASSWSPHRRHREVADHFTASMSNTCCKVHCMNG
ncbi:hypothetical protein PoB_007329700 [Plakobranchus ocellatus]|uniref:Uncharacterized protein n=1 Tax=Plakobranchus ocellatus TaxID=259542 RepID=A0AAV4DRW4_9GAST|nr:hypothetical protein PoB_007329700 [Plakobranchus ocellatus]